MSTRGKGPLFVEPDCDAARQWFREKPKRMSDKVMSVGEAVRRFVSDDDYLASGGFGGDRIATALLHEIVRQQRQRLSFAGHTATHDFQVLCAGNDSNPFPVTNTAMIGKTLVASRPKPTNPFYIVLLIAGVLFVVTACSYFVMAIKGRDMSLGGQEDPSSKRFVEIVDRYGFAALMIELGVLAGATFAAIGTDEYWTRRAEREAHRRQNEDFNQGDEP